MTHPTSSESTDDQQRSVENAVRDAREEADLQRQVRRDVHDHTRQHERGGQQVRAGLRRERALDDQELARERGLEDRARAAERRSAAEASAEQAGLLEAAETRLSQVLVENDGRSLDLRNGQRAMHAELTSLEALLRDLLRAAAGQPLEPRLAEGVELLRASAARIRRLLDATLDSDDACSNRHDIGGSG